MAPMSTNAAPIKISNEVSISMITTMSPYRLPYSVTPARYTRKPMTAIEVFLFDALGQ